MVWPTTTGWHCIVLNGGDFIRQKGKPQRRRICGRVNVHLDLPKLNRKIFSFFPVRSVVFLVTCKLFSGGQNV